MSTLLAGFTLPATPADTFETYAKAIASTSKRDYLSWVDPRIESARGRWFFSTPAARPFGIVKLTPHTVNRGQGGGGYNSSVHTALGFCHLHGWMTTGLEVMPTAGGDFSVTEGEAGWKSTFDPTTEIVKPGYHKLFLEKYGTWVELTTTRRVGMHRYTYPKGGRADIVINLGGPVGPMKMRNGRIFQTNDAQLEGYYERTDGTWGGPAAVRIFFVIRCETPFSKFTTYRDPAHNSISGLVTYDNVPPGGGLQMKAALSFTSIANARANLAAELDHWNFDSVRDESFRVWNAWLSRMDVEGGTDAQRTKFYTDLWHVLLGRHVLNDVGGAYPDYTNGRGGNDTPVGEAGRSTAQERPVLPPRIRRRRYAGADARSGAQRRVGGCPAAAVRISARVAGHGGAIAGYPATTGEQHPTSRDGQGKKRRWARCRVRRALERARGRRASRVQSTGSARHVGEFRPSRRVHARSDRHRR